MRLSLALFICLLCCPVTQGLTQSDIDHWEAVAQDGSVWSYLVPSGQPTPFWKDNLFNDEMWPVGPSGFGYGDGDDETVVPVTPSIYLRHTFELGGLDDYPQAVFAMDYDDGYVAYLNGVEIARENAGLPGENVAWDATLDDWHEAVLYSGGTPELFPLDVFSAFQEGTNVLAVEVHNANPGSSDLTARPFLFVGTSQEAQTFGPLPSWYVPASSDTHNVTFNLNMELEDVAPEGVFVAGGGYFGVPGDNPMSDPDGDGVWSATLQVPHGFSGNYIFVNGACGDWSCKENLAGQDCADPSNYNDRSLENVTSDLVVSTCFGQCTTDGSCAPLAGCTDPEALNYWSSATVDDGSCVYLNESNLPLIQITSTTSIVDEPRILATMAVTNNASGFNHIDDEPNEYNGQIAIEIRGSSSQFFPKKSYALETQDSLGMNNNVSLLGMPAENDWILYGPYTDKSLIRNAVMYEMGDKINRYTTRRRFCELFINGDYRGVYLFMENIKRDENRVDIATLLPTDIDGDEVTGGYILKVDRIQGDFEGGWPSPYASLGGGEMSIQLHKPEADDLHPNQLAYIEDHFTAFEQALAGNNFMDPVLGYAPYIDAHSFVDLYLANEVSKNIDGYRLSTYFYKQKDSNGGKIVMGPWWDYNLAFGNADYCEAVNTAGFEANTGCGNENPFWFERLLEDPSYSGLTRCVWEDYRSGPWSNESIHATIDSLVTLLAEPSIRDHERWPRLGTYVWPNAFIGDTYEEEVQFLRDWIDGRLAWLDANIEGTCVTGCTDEAACNFNPSALYDDGSCEPCGCPQDIDNDGVVTVSDILAALSEFGCTSGCTSDVNGDDQVTVSDFLEILSQYGEFCN
jgi:hypothetical protein